MSVVDLLPKRFFARSLRQVVAHRLSMLAAAIMVAMCGQALAETLPTRPKPYIEELPLAPIDWRHSPPSNPSRDQLRSSDSRLVGSRGGVELLTERYENRAIKIQRQVRQDAQRNYHNDGNWTMWDPQGRVLAQGQYRRGKRHGAWIRYLPHGLGVAAQFQAPLISQAEFKDGRLHGTWTINDANQRAIASWEFEQGVLQGKAIAWYPSGQQQSEMIFEKGQPHGEATFWRADGAIASKQFYRHGQQLVPVVQRYDQQQKESEGWMLRSNFTYTTNIDWWNDIIDISRIPADGDEVKTGLWKEWHLNGNLSFQGSFENGQPVGQHTWWHENGQKSVTGVYRDGREHLVWTQWHPSGMKQEEGSYLAGVKQGTWTQWDEEGNVASVQDMSKHPQDPSDALEDSPAEESGLSLEPALTMTDERTESTRAEYSSSN